MSVDLRPWLDAVPNAAATAIAGARRALVATHENPDADTLGAALGVAAIVEHHGGRVTLVSTDPVPPLYEFLAGMERFVQDPAPDGDYDLLVICDCGSLDRLGEVRQRHRELFERTPRVLVDHHASNTDGGARDWVDPGAAATCEMVTLLAAKLGVPLDVGDGSMAAALMAGIVMDTSTFAHPNATPRTLAVAAALVDAGAPLADISRRLYRSKPDAQLRLFGRVLDRLEVTPGGHVIHRPRPAAGSSIRPCSTRTSRPAARSRRTRRGSSTSSPSPSRPRWRSCSRRPAPSPRECRSGRSPAGSMPRS